MDASIFKKCMITWSSKLFLVQFYGVPTTISDCMIAWLSLEYKTAGKLGPSLYNIANVIFKTPFLTVEDFGKS